MVTIRNGVNLKSKTSALTLDSYCVNEDGTPKFHSGSGWTISGKRQDDYYTWVNEFTAYHQEFGLVKGDFETIVEAESLEGFNHFYKYHTPVSWDYKDL